MKRAILGLGALSLLCVAVPQARAHTISLGNYNAGAPGSVTLSMGTYGHGTPIFQGAMTLTTGPGIPPTVTQNFSSVTTTKPLGLIDGLTNFYADAQPGQWGTLPSNSYNSPTNLVGIGAVVNWQEVTFTGLSTGTYSYTLSGMTSQNWENINSFQSNWSGTFTVTAAVAGAIIPEPATLAVFGGIALAGALGYRRRKATTSV